MSRAVLTGPLFQGNGRAEDFCGNEPKVPCRLFWNITHSPDATRFVHAYNLDTWINKLVAILIIAAIAMVANRIAHRMITRITLRMGEGTMPEKLREKTRTIFDGSPALLSERRRQRAQTLGSVLRSICSVVILGTAAFTVLGELGINLAPFLASASIIGLAVGFGAQNLVKDFLSGMFMMLEDQYGVGDVVDVGEATGTVEAVGLRVTTLRDAKGTVWYVRNGEVLRVGNSSQGYSVAIVDLPIGHHADIPTTTELAGRTAAELTAEGSTLASDVLEPPEVLGIESISSDGVTLRITTKVRAGRQWAVQRALLAGIKAAFAEAGVPPPSPAGLTAPQA